MKRAGITKEIVYGVLCYVKFFYTCMLYVTNRWYIFRNEPDWYVKRIMRIPNGDCERNKKEVNQIIKEARDEMKLRGRRRYLGYYS